jgi:EAL domain-containing protein (putative c-di-GMP-specific phosphodiesterase class I)
MDDNTPNMPNLDDQMAMPIRAIKLDRSIVISKTPTDQTFIRAMIAKATTANQNIIAEGIETPALRDAMRNLGVTHGQGYLFSHPLPAPALQAFLSSDPRRNA